MSSSICNVFMNSTRNLFVVNLKSLKITKPSTKNILVYPIVRVSMNINQSNIEYKEKKSVYVWFNFQTISISLFILQAQRRDYSLPPLSQRPNGV